MKKFKEQLFTLKNRSQKLEPPLILDSLNKFVTNISFVRETHSLTN